MEPQDWRRARRLASAVTARPRVPPMALPVLWHFTVGIGRGSRRTLRILSPVFRPLYRFRYKISAARAEVARERTLAAVDRRARERQPSGYLVGDGLSVADLTAAALFYPLVQPP